MVLLFFSLRGLFLILLLYAVYLYSVLFFRDWSLPFYCMLSSVFCFLVFRLLSNLQLHREMI